MEIKLANYQAWKKICKKVNVEYYLNIKISQKITAKVRVIENEIYLNFLSAIHETLYENCN